MDYAPNNPNPRSASDFLGVSNAAADLRSHAADRDMKDFAATQPQTVKAVAVDKAQQFREAAAEKAQAFKAEAQVKLKEGAQKLKDIQADAEVYIRENPTKAVLTAAGIGLVIGLIVRR